MADQDFTPAEREVIAKLVARFVREATAQLPSPSEWLTVEEAAGELKVAARTLYDEIAATQPPWALRIGRVIRVHRPKLLEAMAATPRTPPRKRRSRRPPAPAGEP